MKVSDLFDRPGLTSYLESAPSVWLSLLYSALTEHLLRNRPYPGCCGSSSEQSRQGLFSHEAMSSPPKGEKAPPGKEGDVFIFYSDYRTEKILRDTAPSVILMALIGDYAGRGWVFPEDLWKIRSFTPSVIHSHNH